MIYKMFIYRYCGEYHYTSVILNNSEYDLFMVHSMDIGPAMYALMVKHGYV